MSSCTACATGLHAIGDAATFIAIGRAKRMIAGATEACINPIAITGFQRLRLFFFLFGSNLKEFTHFQLFFCFFFRSDSTSNDCREFKESVF